MVNGPISDDRVPLILDVGGCLSDREMKQIHQGPRVRSEIPTVIIDVWNLHVLGPLAVDTTTHE